jgi:hypothetical protein
MAHTCDRSASRSLCQPRNTTKVDIVPKSATKGFTKGASKAEVPSTAIRTETESATVIEDEANMLKCTYEVVDDGYLLNTTTTSKKARKVLTAEVVEGAKTEQIRRSVRTQPTKPAVKNRRKRRTKAEIEADKEKAEAEKKKKHELVVEKECAMLQMNSAKDRDRTEATT